MYYGLIDITSNLILNTLLIISGAIFNILVVKFLKLEEKLLKNKKLLIIYLVFIVVAINIFDWIIQPMINYFNIINYLPLSFFAGFGGGILVSFFYLIIWENNKYLTHSKF
ncbi:membrane protein of unknown function [Methanocaldococcus lauensis]|uniref:hypothetical protein n=1 Tax=Methanocaldococcus sp. TaxID=2152917 RepID=UPI001BED44E9|nr:hypothetical protein [Methanocaldococcus sp.]CAB3288046.1 membrane protein of unknown function [Methanocaldococcus lauensis]